MSTRGDGVAVGTTVRPWLVGIAISVCLALLLGAAVLERLAGGCEQVAPLFEKP